MKRAKPKSTLKERLEWLRRHPELIHLPYYSIKKAMVDADLIAESTYILDIRLPDTVRQVHDEIELKKEQRKRGR